MQEGDFVRQGATLVRLDDRDYEASLRRSEATRELAKVNLLFKQKQAVRRRNQHARRTPVRLGEELVDSVQITGGLNGGEALIVSGLGLLRDGRVVEAALRETATGR